MNELAEIRDRLKRIEEKLDDSIECSLTNRGECKSKFTALKIWSAIQWGAIAGIFSSEIYFLWWFFTEFKR